MTIATATRYVYDFAEGSRDMRALLGGKGANIAEMTRVLGPELVPAGIHDHDAGLFRVHARRRRRARRAGRAGRRRRRTPRGRAGRALGDPDDPLLVSVRSGARDSMPGMLETILDLGLNDASVEALPREPATSGSRGTPTGASCRCSATSCAACRVNASRRSCARRATRRRADDRRLSVGNLRDITHRFRTLYEAHTGEPFPQDPQDQLRLAIRAVFDSWLGDRAVAYRRINHIPDDWGTAVNVQQMVFGNRGAGSATGVAFSRDEMTGAPEPSGDFLLDAQGEDVVSGSARRARCRSWPASCLRRTRSCWRSCARSRPTTATCRTSSSRSNAGACTCCRRAGPNARLRPPSASRSMRSTRACSRPRKRCHDRRRLPRCADAPDVRPGRTVRGARPRRGRLARRGQGRSRLHRRGGGRGRRAGARRDPRAPVHGG